MINRRQVLTGAAALGLSSSLPLPSSASTPDLPENKYLISYLRLARAYEPDDGFWSEDSLEPPQHRLRHLTRAPATEETFHMLAAKFVPYQAKAIVEAVQAITGTMQDGQDAERLREVGLLIDRTGMSEDASRTLNELLARRMRVAYANRSHVLALREIRSAASLQVSSLQIGGTNSNIVLCCRMAAQEVGGTLSSETMRGILREHERILRDYVRLAA